MYLHGEQIETYHTGNTFMVERVCDGGGMGLVFIARRKKDGKLYALKTLKVWSAEKKDLIKKAIMLRWESLVWITLGRHRNIVQAHWFDLDIAYRPFLIMECIEGRTEQGVSLRERLKSSGRLSLPLAIDFTIQALTGLIYAMKVVRHERKIPFIHRDIKPENLLIDQQDILKVTDFGLVRGFGSIEEGKVGGTFPYMPPEQWKGEEVEEKTDIYALGCSLYEMITGRKPFICYDKWGYWDAHMNRKPTPPDRGDVPEDLKEIVLRCLFKEWAYRPGFSELREGLQKIHEELTGKRVPVEDKPDPLTAEDFNARGTGFSQLGSYQKAIACYDSAIAMKPDEAKYYLNRGNTYSSLNEVDMAKRDYEKASVLSPHSTEPYIGLGSLHAQNRDYTRGSEYYSKAIELFPDNPAVYVGIGNHYGVQRQFKKAGDALKKALSLQPDLAEAYLGLGNLHLCQKEYAESEKHYKKALRLNPFYARAYMNLAHLYQIMGKERERDEALEMVELLMPFSKDSLLNENN